MKHNPNVKLAEGTYRIVCSKCQKIFEEGKGEITQANLDAMGYADTCDKCGGKVVLETNPTPQKNKYDAEHPYP